MQGATAPQQVQEVVPLRHAIGGAGRAGIDPGRIQHNGAVEKPPVTCLGGPGAREIRLHQGGGRRGPRSATAWSCRTRWRRGAHTTVARSAAAYLAAPGQGRGTACAALPAGWPGLGARACCTWASEGWLRAHSMVWEGGVRHQARQRHNRRQGHAGLEEPLGQRRGDRPTSRRRNLVGLRHQHRNGWHGLNGVGQALGLGMSDLGQP